MKIIGLTGRSGCGKSTVAGYLRKAGYPVTDCDQIAHAILEPGSSCVNCLVDVFGADILDEQGRVKRHLLAQRAYADPKDTQALVNITHPEITRRLLAAAAQAQAQGAGLFFADGAVIVGAPFQAYCDAILLVTAPLEESVSRICRRDGISRQAALARLSAQLPEEQLRRAAAFEIRNDGDSLQLIVQTQQALAVLEGGV